MFLIFGILGLVFYVKNDKKSFWVLMVLFFFMGLVFKVYFNERFFEFWERDYVVVGLFYVFVMWIGFGVYVFYEVVKDYLKLKVVFLIVFVVIILVVLVFLVI